jgi:hypothetical protein
MILAVLAFSHDRLSHSYNARPTRPGSVANVIWFMKCADFAGMGSSEKVDHIE